METVVSPYEAPEMGAPVFHSVPLHARQDRARVRDHFNIRVLARSQIRLRAPRLVDKRRLHARESRNWNREGKKKPESSVWTHSPT